MENGSEGGWIKLFRKMQQWEWYKISSCVHLLIHLSFTANREDKTWRGILIKRGQRVTTRKQLSVETGISEQTIHTDIKRLQLTNSIVVQPTNKYTIITVCNYELYQGGTEDVNQQINQQVTNTPTTELTTTKEDKKKEKNKLLSSTNASAYACVRKGQAPELNSIWADELRMMVRRNKGITLTDEEISRHYEEFKIQREAEMPDDMTETYAEWRKHFANYIRLRAGVEKTHKQEARKDQIWKGDFLAASTQTAAESEKKKANTMNFLEYQELKKKMQNGES